MPKNREQYTGRWYTQEIDATNITDDTVTEEVSHVRNLLAEYSRLEQKNQGFILNNRSKDNYAEIREQASVKRHELLSDIINSCQAPAILEYCQSNRKSEFFLDLHFIQKKALSMSTLPLAPNDGLARKELIHRGFGNGTGRRVDETFKTEFRYEADANIMTFANARVKEFYCEYLENQQGKTQRASISYLNDEQKSESKTTIKDGLIYLDNNPVTTPALYGGPREGVEEPKDYHQRKENKHYIIYAMDVDKNLYLREESTEDLHIRHSSFLRGAPVLCAGKIEIADGQLKLITTDSGHYKPTANDMYKLVKALDDKGVDLSKVDVVIFGEGYNAERFLRMKGNCLPDTKYDKAMTQYADKSNDDKEKYDIVDAKKEEVPIEIEVEKDNSINIDTNIAYETSNVMEKLVRFQDIKNTMEERLTTLKQKLSDNGVSKTKIDELYTGLHNAETKLFNSLESKTDKHAIESALKTFVNECEVHTNQADKVMGHGWLHKTVEITVKAVVGVFAGLGMVLATPFGHGLANPNHVQAFKDTFLKLKQTDANKTIADFKEETQNDINKFKM